VLLQALTRASIKNWTMPGHCLFGTAQFVYRGSGQDNLGCAAPGAPFLRKIGIEISFARKGRARTRTIHIATPPEPRKHRGATVRIVRTVRARAEIQSRQRLRGSSPADGNQRCGRSGGR
jgi:hypothetical protein